MKLMYKVMLVICVTCTGLLVCSSGIEWKHYKNEMEDMQVFIELSAKEALSQQQDIFLQWNKLGSAVAATDAAHSYSIISGRSRDKIQEAITLGKIGPLMVKNYTGDVSTKARTAGLEEFSPTGFHTKPSKDETELFRNLEVLSDLASDTTGKNYNPLQFGLSYVDEELLNILFQDNLERIIEMNYNSEMNVVDGTRVNHMSYRDAWIKVNGPTLVNLADLGNKPLYSSLYGVNVKDSDYRSMIETKLGYGKDFVYDAFSGYIVVYEIEFCANGWHNMTTPLGVKGGINNVMFGTQDIKPGVKDVRWFTRDLGDGITQDYISIGLPVQVTNQQYVVMN